MTDRYRAGKRLWSEEDDTVMRERYPHERTETLAVALRRTTSAVYKRAEKLGLLKSEAFLATPDSGRTNGRQGIGTRFQKGQVPANKGLRRPGWAPGRMRETQFRKGERRGIAVQLHKPVGTERISKDGYRERKVAELDPTGLSPEEANRRRQRLWVAVHRIVWEEANGPIPKGHLIAFKNGDKTDVRLENLECISRQEWMARNTIHNLPKPLASAIQLLGALNRRIRSKTNEEPN